LPHCFIFIVNAFVVRAEEPMAQLSASINEFVTIMSNTSVAECGQGLPEKARQLVFARFDFSEMTKRSLGSHWKSTGSSGTA